MGEGEHLRGPDGHDILEGQACIFGSLKAVIKKFPQFYELLSHEAVTNYCYRAVFRQAEGQPVRQKSMKVIARNPDSKQMMKGDQLSADVCLDNSAGAALSALQKEQQGTFYFSYKAECPILSSGTA